MAGWGVRELWVIGLNLLENEPRELPDEQAAGFSG
jgi:hypothetical protein